MKTEKLSEVVELITDFSYNVNWEKPIHMIFIDGLHDYQNVARDFWHFSTWIAPNGYIIFLHDYAVYPGIIAFVNKPLKTQRV